MSFAKPFKTCAHPSDGLRVSGREAVAGPADGLRVPAGDSIRGVTPLNFTQSDT
jgi:hypothetical protein